MTISKTFAITAMLASIAMVALPGTSLVSAQIFNNQHADENALFDLYLLNDQSGSITASNTNPTCGVVDGGEGEWETELDGKAAGLQALFGAAPELFGKVQITIIGFATTSEIKLGPTVITDGPTLDAFTAAICNIPKDLGTLTCISCAFDDVSTALAASTFATDDLIDVQIVDLITDGDPTVGTQPPIPERDQMVTDGIDIIVALGIGASNEVDANALADLVWPNPPGPIISIDDLLNDQNVNLPEHVDEQGFVLTVPGFEGFAEAFTQKLLAEIIDLCPNGELDEGEECDDGNMNNNDECNNFCQFPRVGGEFLPIDSSALFIAGLSANLSLIAPIVLGIAGVSAYIIRSRMIKD